MLGSNKHKDTINWLVRAVDRQLIADRQYDDRGRGGVELADANDVVVVYHDRGTAFLDWSGNDISLIRWRAGYRFGKAEVTNRTQAAIFLFL
jgi:hypothetical protein